jgi:hypothetical protein
MKFNYSKLFNLVLEPIQKPLGHLLLGYLGPVLGIGMGVLRVSIGGDMI